MTPFLKSMETLAKWVPITWIGEKKREDTIVAKQWLEYNKDYKSCYKEKVTVWPYINVVIAKLVYAWQGFTQGHHYHYHFFSVKCNVLMSFLNEFRVLQDTVLRNTDNEVIAIVLDVKTLHPSCEKARSVRWSPPQTRLRLAGYLL